MLVFTISFYFAAQNQVKFGVRFYIIIEINHYTSVYTVFTTSISRVVAVRVGRVGKYVMVLPSIDGFKRKITISFVPQKRAAPIQMPFAKQGRRVVYDKTHTLILDLMV